MKVCSKKNPMLVYEATELENGRVLLEADDKQKEIAKSTFKKSYMPLDTENAGSMRANSKKEVGRPFIPNPYFLRQSMITQYLQCPNKFYDINENGYKEDTIFTGMGTAIHGIMEDYWKDPVNADVDELFEKWWVAHAPANQDLYNEWRELVPKYFKSNVVGQPKPNIIALELEFKTVIADIPVSGTIDRVDRIDDDTILIIDYKTNMIPYTQDELRESVQFKLYSLALQNLKDVVGDFKKIVCQYEMLRTGQKQYVTFSEEELNIFTDWVKVIWAKMLKGQDRKPKLNKYCGYCQKRHKCQAYLDMINSNVSTVNNEEIDLDQLVKDYDTLKMNIKILKGRLDELDQLIKEAIVDEGGEVLIEGNIWSMGTQQRISYDTSKVAELMAEKGLLDELLKLMPNISSSTIKKLGLSKEDMEKVEDFKQVNYTSPSLKKRKSK